MERWSSEAGRTSTLGDNSPTRNPTHRLTPDRFHSRCSDYKTDGRRCEVIDLGSNLQGSVAESRNLDGPIGSLLRENAPETGNLIVPRIERWPVQLERNALTDYQNPDEPRVVSGKHYMHRPAQGHPDR